MKNIIIGIRKSFSQKFFEVSKQNRFYIKKHKFQGGEVFQMKPDLVQMKTVVLFERYHISF